MLSVVILAAGQGTRMRSALPKVLHVVGDRPLLEHVISTARELGAGEIHVVYGHGGDAVPKALAHLNVNWVLQEQQLGTGHAVAQAISHVKGERVLVLYGDVPLISAATLKRLIEAAGSEVGLLTVELDDPTGYGRIIRDGSGKVLRNVEQKDANASELWVREVNTGFLTAPAAKLSDWLGRLRNDNAQGEYYLTDVLAMAVGDGVAVNTAAPADVHEVLGINNKRQLAEIERHYQRIQATALMDAGVTLRDPARLDVRGQVSCGRDVEIDTNVILHGKVNIGSNTKIGPNCLIINSVIGDGVEILANTVIEEAEIGAGSRVGPFARIRPGTVLAGDAHIGNFVEIKKSTVGLGSKINHLSYVGDATIGNQVNIGAGTITCNYDGANKHQTIIEDEVFVGSDSQLVAPVTIGKGATIGAGATITKNVAPGALALSRTPQASREGWKRPTKKKS
ncbi:MAG: bifunctional UDP-N-acetylglucosamine diphosphorylase/glucosamine-1-phosphate N-acetyltransferase GlmU [Gammaproteobacteria bacterium]|nr:bifunctional UDP-N-acetylglucosamine diphosphorylase/glucosamine-1-phosphate N-acetyltransferase GlmU [Gammaproteobacteria bacterium]